mgnify:CR=1 FL=1
MAKIADKGVGETGTVTVSGHTDNVPLMFGGNFRDNWDLAAARASSVVQELEKEKISRNARIVFPIQSLLIFNIRQVSRAQEIIKYISLWQSVPAVEPEIQGVSAENVFPGVDQLEIRPALLRQIEREVEKLISHLDILLPPANEITYWIPQIENDADLMIGEHSLQSRRLTKVT